MPLFDVKCAKCKTEGECFLSSGQSEAICPCGGAAPVYWKSFGGMMGKNKGVYPLYDRQLGVTLESSQHRDRVLKQRGLMALGNDEFKRTLDNQHDPEPQPLSKDPAFVEAMEKAHYEIEHNMLPPEEPRSLDPGNGQLIMAGQT